ncbi:MAG: hypothetical protein U5Q03_00965 [Bacteroidota bacterium]|nr:hypothetical protein [Bacteroidota bacterium]
MKISFLELLRKIISNSWDRKQRKHLYIFLLCLGISIFIWLMIKLSNDYYSTLTYHVDYVNIPDDNLLAPDADSTIAMNIEAQGFKLFSLKYLRRNPKIEIDLQKTRIHKNRYRFGFYVLTSSLRNKLEQELKLTDESFSIYPDTLSFVLEQLSTKKIPVRSQVSFTLKKQHQLKGEIRIQPDSIMISGIPSILNTLNYISTEEMKLGEINSSKSLRLALKKFDRDKKIKLLRDSVSINIPVVKYTEASMMIPIRKPEKMSREVKFFPAQVEVVFLVTLPDYDKVNAGMFTAEISEINEDKAGNTLEVNLSHTPNFVKVVKIRPEKVEYIILK